MSIEKLERVMWRLRARNPDKLTLTINELERCIMHEIGTDRRTYRDNKAALIKLGWIRSKGKRYIWLTGKDLSGD